MEADLTASQQHNPDDNKSGLTNYRDVISQALAGVKQELLVIIDGQQYLAYVHDVQVNEGKLYIDWSTPHDREEIDREILFKHVYKAVSIQINEGMKCQQSAKRSSPIFSFLKSIFVRRTHS